MPLVKSKYVPETKYLSEYNGIFPSDLENYVLKPLFSCAGTGVIYDVKPEDVTSISDPENYILQKKIFYIHYGLTNVLFLVSLTTWLT